MECNKALKIMLAFSIIMFTIAASALLTSLSLQKENARLKAPYIMEGVAAAVPVQVISNETRELREILGMVDSMNTEENTKLLSKIIRHTDAIPLLSVALEKKELTDLIHADAIEITVGRYPMFHCFVVDKGLFPNCIGSQNVTTLELSYDDVKFAYQNQDLIHSAMQDGNISSYEMSKIITSRILYVIQKPKED